MSCVAPSRVVVISMHFVFALDQRAYQVGDVAFTAAKTIGDIREPVLMQRAGGERDASNGDERADERRQVADARDDERRGAYGPDHRPGDRQRRRHASEIERRMIALADWKARIEPQKYRDIGKERALRQCHAAPAI